jgi:predicted XRE-type DNA-binding protein
LAAKIVSEIRRRKLTQTQAAVILGVDQPKVSALKQGKLDGFSIERLMRLLLRLGRDIEITVREKPIHLRGQPIRVETCCHPTRDAVAVRMTGDIPVHFEFSDPALARATGKPPTFICEFSRQDFAQAAPTVEETFARAAIAGRVSGTAAAPLTSQHVAMSESMNWSDASCFRSISPRLQCAGSTPPQETGLTCNSWYGKFHLEMHWWHAAHFPLWGRSALLERSFPWYLGTLPSARDHAKQQGYAECRWPKMTDPSGRDSPSPIGPLLIWQQLHPIALIELCFQSNPTRAMMLTYRDVVLGCHHRKTFRATGKGWRLSGA